MGGHRENMAILSYEITDLEGAILELGAAQEGLVNDSVSTAVEEYFRRLVSSSLDQLRTTLRTARENELVIQAQDAIMQGMTFTVSVDLVTQFPVGQSNPIT